MKTTCNTIESVRDGRSFKDFHQSFKAASTAEEGESESRGPGRNKHAKSVEDLPSFRKVLRTALNSPN